MAKKLSKLQLAQQKAETAAKKTNQKINDLVFIQVTFTLPWQGFRLHLIAFGMCQKKID